MRTLILYFVIGVAAAAAWGADRVWAPSLPHTGGTVQPAPNGDASLELYWDNGVCTNDVAWYTGANTWSANDFSTATLSAYNLIYSARLYYWPNWPNNTWEGNGMAVHAFSGGTPGSILMPSRYVRGSGAIGGWQVYSVNWSLGTTTSWMMSFSQLYNYPSCDPVMPLSSGGTSGHSWYYYNGVWTLTKNMCYCNNTLMIRVTLDDTPGTAITPSSLGRVKAIFH